MTRDRFSVLVVCTGNVNRSALGAALLSTWAGWYLPDERADEVRVASAGLRAPVGNRMGRRARVIAEALGASWGGHRAAQITEAAIRSADLVLVSSADQRDAVLGIVPGALRSTFTIPEAGRIAESLADLPLPSDATEMRERVAELARNRTTGAAGDLDIVDPQGRDDEAYRLMARQEVPPLAHLAGVLFGMPPAEIRAVAEAAEAAAFRFDEDGPEPEAPERRRGRREA
jgi:protein-tyrosine phosphatase